MDAILFKAYKFESFGFQEATCRTCRVVIGAWPSRK